MAFNNRNYTNYGATSYDTEVVVQPGASGEIDCMSDDVSSSVESVSNCIKYFTSITELIGTEKDSNGLRDQILTRIMSSNHLIKKTEKDISTLTGLSRGASKRQKVQIRRLTENFKDLVEKNCQIQQVILDKLRTHTPWSPDNMMESSGDQTGLLQLEQVQLQKNLEFEKDMLLERQQRIKQIETQILDANILTQKLSELIHNQGIMVDTIENQIENVNVNVHLGHQSLTSAEDYANRARKKKLFLLSVLALILIVIIGVIIWSATS